MNPSNGPAVQTGADWMRRVEKQSLQSSRRPNITHASQIMGPGIAPHAVEIKNWSGEETLFNGYFYSKPGSFNSPDGTKWWIGQTITMIEGFGIQQVWDFRGVTSPPTLKTRKFSLSGATRTFSSWA